MLLNPGWWEVDCTLKLGGPTPRMLHLNDDQSYTGSTVTIHLLPFATESFELQGATRLAVADGRVSDHRPAAMMRKALSALAAYQRHANRRPQVSGGEPLRSLNRISEQLKGYVAREDWARAYQLTQSIEYCRALNWAKTELTGRLPPKAGN